MGWRWLGVWGGWGGRVDSEEGEGCQGEIEERGGEEGVLGLFRFNMRGLGIYQVFFILVHVAFGKREHRVGYVYSKERKCICFFAISSLLYTGALGISYIPT